MRHAQLRKVEGCGQDRIFEQESFHKVELLRVGLCLKARLRSCLILHVLPSGSDLRCGLQATGEEILTNSRLTLPPLRLPCLIIPDGLLKCLERIPVFKTAVGISHPAPAVPAADDQTGRGVAQHRSS
eukprot:767257-Hanusia_phi.AAC.6